MSPLQVSSTLFMLGGLTHVLIGVLTPLLHDRAGDHRMVVMSPRTDVLYFGAEPADLLADDSALSRLRTVLFMMLAGALVGWGLLETAIAWYAVRDGDEWALVTLSVVPVAVLPLWYLVCLPYVRADIRLRLGDVPPFIWVPTALWLPASILGWIGI